MFSLGEGVTRGRPRHQLQNQKDTSPAPARSGSRKASVTLTPRLHCPLAAPRTWVPRGPAISEPALKEPTLQGPPPPGRLIRPRRLGRLQPQREPGASTPCGPGPPGSTEGAWGPPPCLSGGHMCHAAQDQPELGTGASRGLPGFFPAAIQPQEA